MLDFLHKDNRDNSRPFISVLKNIIILLPVHPVTCNVFYGQTATHGRRSRPCAGGLSITSPPRNTVTLLA